MKYIIEGEVRNRSPHRYREYEEKAEAKIFGSGSLKFLWEV